MIPAPICYAPEDLAGEWKCPVSRVWGYIRTGQVKVWALLPASEIPNLGATGYVGVPVDYPSLAWNAEGWALLNGNAVAHPLASPDIAIRFTAHNLAVRESDLSVPASQKDEAEGATHLINPRERSTFLHMIGTMAQVSYGADALEHPYETATSLQEDIAVLGHRVSRETLAQKLAEARDIVQAKRTAVQVDG